MNVTDEEIFSAAISYSSQEQQDQYVVSTCPPDSAQYQRVMQLLKSHRRLTSCESDFVLDRTTEVVEVLSAGSVEETDKTIGPYRVLQLLGEGGMGLVYLAEQQLPIRRRVALKVLKPGMDSQKVLARFELERQALAGMEHPGITRILDAGITDTRRPYFVMELVKGIAITEYCTSNQVAAMDRIRLMIQVCSAIQHAHQRGVIHRDIKPSNILIAHSDGQPQPKVIDFGIAKLVNDSLGFQGHFTHHGELVGTPAYMSPEQALSKADGVDIRTDVYSLGVLIYELMTGETPLAIKGSTRVMAGVRQLISDSRIELPSQRVQRKLQENTNSPQAVDVHRDRKFLQGDVDCIVMRALARDPNDRYQSVAELQRDLERFVDGRPIEAAPPSLVYLARKVIQRHRALAMFASLACGLIIVASGVAIWFGVMATDATRVARQRLKEVLDMQSELQIERDRAVQAEKKSRLLAQTYLTPALIDKVANRFCVEHWEHVVQANPKVEELDVPAKERFNQQEVLMTLFTSNLLTPHPRMIIHDDVEWLVKLLSEISHRDIRPYFTPLTEQTAAERSAAIETTISSTVTPVPAAGSVLGDTVRSSAEAPIPVGIIEVDVGQALPLSPVFQFSPTALKDFQQMMCDELSGIDDSLPILADTKDTLGLLLMDLNQFDAAAQNFLESLRIREDFPELKLQSLQTRLFLADCRSRQGDRQAAIAPIEEIVSQLKTFTSGTESPKAASLEKYAQELKASLLTEVSAPQSP